MEVISVPMNSKKSESGTKHGLFGRCRPSERKSIMGAPLGLAGGKHPAQACELNAIVHRQDRAADFRRHHQNGDG